LTTWFLRDASICVRRHPPADPAVAVDIRSLMRAEVYTARRITLRPGEDTPTPAPLNFFPYIQELAEAVPKTGEPILRPLWYNFPSERGADGVTDEFMLGDAVLVAPVVIQGQRQRDIYLPAGQWREYKTRKIIDGGRTVRDYPAPLDTLPIFIKVKAATGKLPD
jgi:hypothetical protein